MSRVAGTAFTVTVTAASPTITLGANPSVCSGATIANLPYTGTTGAPNQYSITYNAAAIAAGFVNVAFTALPASPIVLVVPAGAPVATYGGTITVRNGAAGCPSAGTPFLITVSAPPTITLGANPVICSGATTANLPYTATTNSPDQYSIVYSAAALAAGFVNVPNTALPATPIVLTVPAGAPAATYSGTLTVTNSTTGCVSATSPFTVTINPIPSITLGANPSVCSGATSANLPYTATTGTPNQYSITYSAAALAAGFVNVANAALPATPIVLVVPAAAAPATYTATLTVTNSIIGCPGIGTPFTVTVNATPTITLGANPSVCGGATTANLPYTATTGGPNQYSITYSAAAIAAGFVNVANAALPATPIVLVVPAAAAPATYSATLSVTNSATGCVGIGIPFTITVNTAVTITGAAPAVSVCSGLTSVNLTYTSTTGAPNQYSITYTAAAIAQGFVNVVNAALPPSPIVIVVPALAAAGTYAGNTLTVTNSATGCSQSRALSIVINAAPLAPTLAKVDPTCAVATGTITITSSTVGLTFSLDGAAYAAYPVGGYTGVAPGAHTITARNASLCISPVANITIAVQPTPPAAPTASVTVQPTCAIQQERL